MDCTMRIAVVSLNFSIGHLSHILAYYELIRESGFEPVLILHEEYKRYFPHQEYQLLNLEEIGNEKIDLSVVYSPAAANLNYIRTQRGKRGKVLYVLHEPFPGWKQFMEIKGSNKIRLYLIHQYQAICTAVSSKVLLGSKYAVSVYLKNGRIFKNSAEYFPLIFQDERTPAVETEKRAYFSFIGGFIEPHGCRAFIRFMQYCHKQHREVRFRIATRHTLSESERTMCEELVQSQQLEIVQGRPLTTEEINRYYGESICVWSAYDISMQSGVLPKAFMLGTPVIASDAGSFREFVRDGENGIIVKDNTDCAELYEAYKKICGSCESYSKNARKTFEAEFYYKNKVELFQKIVAEVLPT